MSKGDRCLYVKLCGPFVTTQTWTRGGAIELEHTARVECSSSAVALKKYRRSVARAERDGYTSRESTSPFSGVSPRSTLDDAEDTDDTDGTESTDGSDL